MRDKHSSQKILVSITLAVVLLLGSGMTVMAWRLHENQPAATKAVASDHTQPAKAVAGDHTERTPAANPKKPAVTHLSYKGQDGKTALDLLKQQATIVTKDSSYGQYVDSINGVTGGTNGKYWTFYVNGAQAQVGAGAYTTKSTDLIEWKFE